MIQIKDRRPDAVGVNTIRKDHLRRLIEREGSARCFADKTGINEDYLSSILSENSKRNPGSSLMRRVERAYELQPGSLDFPDQRTTAAAMAIQSLDEQYEALIYDTIALYGERAATPEARESVARYLAIARVRGTPGPKRRR